MAKKKNPKQKRASKMKPVVTMKALEEMSDSSSDEMPPESEWDKKTRDLKNTIESGDFDSLLAKKNDDNEEEESVEEVVLEEEIFSEDEKDVEEDKNERKEVQGERAEADDDEEEEEAVSTSSDEEMEDAQTTEPVIKGNNNDGGEEENKGEEDDDSDEEDEDNFLRKKNAVNSKALRVVTEEVTAMKEGMAWAETFAIVPSTPLPFGSSATKLNIHDDLKREVAFFDTALEAVKEARVKCKEANITFSRPDDFFAEMVKTDGTYISFFSLIYHGLFEQLVLLTFDQYTHICCCSPFN